jgi:hypothetical protein
MINLTTAFEYLESKKPLYWNDGKKRRKVIIDKIVAHYEKVIFDEPMIFVKVMYRGYKIVVEWVDLKDLHEK